MDFTAAWCLSCQVNERLVLNPPTSSTSSAKTTSPSFAPTGPSTIPRSPSN
ncbi:MAG: hypothetical protein WDN23_10845 [Edaphobacter sp.]